MERHILVVQAALQLRDELAGLLGDEHATSWAELDAVLAQALQRAIEEPGPATLKSLLAAARSHPLTAARMAELLGGQWRNAAPAATAATSPGPGVADSAPAGFEKVEVLYATNRAAGNGKRPEEAYGALLAADNRLALGRCIVTLPSKRARETPIQFATSSDDGNFGPPSAAKRRR